MASFFSGTDQSTLQEEGNDRNHFVSLIVNNAGEYTAAITRKISYIETRKISYKTFDNLEVNTDEEFERVEEIEWFPLDIVFENNTNPHISEINDRIISIKKTKEEIKSKYNNTAGISGITGTTGISNTYKPQYYNSFRDVPSVVVKEPTLFDNTEFSYSVPSKEEKAANNAFSDKHITKDLVKSIVNELLTGCILLDNNTKQDMNHWLDVMEATFDKRFGTNNSLFNFNCWATSYVEYLMWYSIDDIDADADTSAHILAQRIIKELDKLPKTNKYIKEYISILETYGN